MRIYEGTPEELREWFSTDSGAETQVVETQVVETQPAQPGIPAEIDRFVRERARNDDTYRRMIDYLTRVQKLGTNFMLGTSKTRTSGHTDYIRVHADGPRLLGAVAYVKPRAKVIDLRLMPEDVADLNDGRVEVLQRKGMRPYRVRFHLSHDAAADLALELTERAIAKLPARNRQHQHRRV